MKTDHSDDLTYHQLEKLKIQSDKLMFGMYVCELDRPWSETPFLLQGFTLQDVDDIAEIRKHCEYVYIDVRKSTHAKGGAPALPDNAIKQAPLNPSRSSVIKTASPTSTRAGILEGLGLHIKTSKQPSPPPEDDTEFLRSLKTSVKNRENTRQLVKSIMEDIRLGKSIDTPAAKEAVAACVDNVMMNKDANLLLTRLRNKDEYTSEHSLNVAIISIAFGRHVGMNRAELNVLGLCGLLHDMGKMLTPTEILNKPEKLTEEEMAVMKHHPLDGREILLNSDKVMDVVIDTAYGHHERLKGQGYPRGIQATEIPLYTRMVTIADVFDAITGDRVYRRGETAETALSVLHRNAGTSFDESLVTQFIQNIGTYPLGSIVEMSNGEIGIVVDNNPTHRLRPKIKLLLSKDRQSREPQTIDLAVHPKDIAGNPYRIKTSHRPGSFGINLAEHINSYVKRD
ncbi:HD-GYP domain-containing protein [Thiolapillus sp.]